MKRPGFATPLAVALLAIAPCTVTAGTLSTEVEGFRVELVSNPAQPRAGQETAYSVRLFDHRGVPVSTARVVLAGRMADGMTVLTPLRPSTESGVYRGAVLYIMEGRWDFTLRVTANGKHFELPLTELVTQ